MSYGGTPPTTCWHHGPDGPGAERGTGIISTVSHSDASYTPGSTSKTVWIKSTSDLVTTPSPVYITVLANSTPNNPHRHEIVEQADHSHSFPADTYEAIPYCVLAFIMKL